MSQRTQRVADLVRRELARILHERLHDPRIKLATVIDVRVTPDLRRAIVKTSVIGNEAEREDSLRALEHAAGFLRSELARNLRNMKVVPQLVFELDRGAEHSQNIEDLLESLHEENQPS